MTVMATDPDRMRSLSVLVIVVILAVAGFPGVGMTNVSDLASAQLLPSPALATDVRGLTLSVEDTEIPVGVDALVNISGSGAHSETVRLYAVGPRGQVYDTSEPNSKGATVSADDMFSTDFSVFDRGGRYVFVAVTAGNDSSFSHGRDTGTSNTRTQRQNVELIRSAYLVGGSDDQLAQASLRTVPPSITIDSPSAETELQAGDLDTSGSSNLPNGTDLFVSILDNDADTIVSDNVTLVEGSWSGTVDLSDIDPGRYMLHVHSPSAGDKVIVWILTADGSRPTIEAPVGSPHDTPTERPTARAPPTRIETRTVVSTVTRTVIRTVYRNRTTTTSSGGLDGFGHLLTIVTLALSGLLAVRRWH